MMSQITWLRTPRYYVHPANTDSCSIRGENYRHLTETNSRYYGYLFGSRQHNFITPTLVITDINQHQHLSTYLISFEIIFSHHYLMNINWIFKYRALFFLCTTKRFRCLCVLDTVPYVFHMLLASFLALIGFSCSTFFSKNLTISNLI